jgi:hypothetical protein
MDPEAETADAIADHNDIRDAVAAVAGHEVGGDDWDDAVAKVNEANSDHMAEEEHEGLTDFRRHSGCSCATTCPSLSPPSRPRTSPASRRWKGP